MVLRTYDDGTEFTTSHMAAAYAIGAIAATAMFCTPLVVRKLNQKIKNRTPKKNLEC